MRPLPLFLLIGIVALVLTVGCAKRESPPTPPQLQGFAVTATAVEGLVPYSIIVNDGADLNIRTFDNDIRITNQELSVDTTIPKGEAEAIRVLPEQPGTYTLTCNGCPAGHDTLTIEVRAAS
jgi:hypothetical protein